MQKWDNLLENLYRQATKMFAEVVVMVIAIMLLLLLVAVFFIWLESKSNKGLNTSLWLKLVRVIT